MSCLRLKRHIVEIRRRSLEIVQCCGGGDRVPESGVRGNIRHAIPVNICSCPSRSAAVWARPFLVMAAPPPDHTFIVLGVSQRTLGLILSDLWRVPPRGITRNASGDDGSSCEGKPDDRVNSGRWLSKAN